MGVGAKVLQWLVAGTSEERPLAGRPPLGAPDPPPRPESAGAGPAPRRRAVCCSGGGIRAAAFALGGVQGLRRREPVATGRGTTDVDLVSAVSGGSYLAGSLAMVNHDAGPTAAATAPYALGSPEDNRLRNHTRYLAEDSRVAAIGVLSILYGLLLNLLPILAGIYVGREAARLDCCTGPACSPSPARSGRSTTPARSPTLSRSPAPGCWRSRSSGCTTSTGRPRNAADRRAAGLGPAADRRGGRVRACFARGCPPSCGC